MKNALPQIFKILAKLCVIIMENAEKESSDDSSELSDDEYAEKLKELSELRAKSEARESTMKDEEAEEEDEEEIKEAVTDFTLYYSPLDRVHELYYVRVKLEEFGAKDRGLYEQLEKALSKEEMEGFRKAMDEAKELQEEIDEENKS